MNTRPTVEEAVSVGVQAARNAAAKDATQDTLDEILEVTEDFAAYIANRCRGITVATRERRRLRTELERVVVEYINATTMPRDLKPEIRPEARVEAIKAQHVETPVDG